MGSKFCSFRKKQKCAYRRRSVKNKLRQSRANWQSKVTVQKSAEVIVPKKVRKLTGGKDRIFKAEEFFFRSSKAIDFFFKKKIKGQRRVGQTEASYTKWKNVKQATAYSLKKYPYGIEATAR